MQCKLFYLNNLIWKENVETGLEEMHNCYNTVNKTPSDIMDMGYCRFGGQFLW